MISLVGKHVARQHKRLMSEQAWQRSPSLSLGIADSSTVGDTMSLASNAGYWLSGSFAERQECTPLTWPRMLLLMAVLGMRGQSDTPPVLTGKAALLQRFESCSQGLQADDYIMALLEHFRV